MLGIFNTTCGVHRSVHIKCIMNGEEYTPFMLYSSISRLRQLCNILSGTAKTPMLRITLKIIPENPNRILQTSGVELFVQLWPKKS